MGVRTKVRLKPKQFWKIWVERVCAKEDGLAVVEYCVRVHEWHVHNQRRKKLGGKGGRSCRRAVRTRESDLRARVLEFVPVR